MKVDYAKRDHHLELTNKIIESMEESKAVNWEKPWFTCKELPVNPVTGTHYRGINVVSTMTAGFDDPRFLTFNNVQELAAREGKEMHVKKGAKGVPVFKAMQVHFGDDEEDVTRSYWKMVYAGTVFNASQIEGMEPLKPRSSEFKPYEEAETLSKALQARTGLVVEHSEVGRAYYSPGGHKVHMPHPERFKDSNAYYDTLLHEFGHSTGPELKRDFTGAKGTATYAKEELVAELSSVFVSAELGIPHNPDSHENHVAYLESWLGALKNDKTFIFKAAGQASKACEFQMGHLNEYKQELQIENHKELSDKINDKLAMKPPSKAIQVTM